MFNVFKNIKESFKIILQGVPNELSTDDIKKVLLAFDEIEAIHDCHLWTMDGEFNIATIHIIVNEPNYTWRKAGELKQKIRKVLHDTFNLEHITLELESLIEDCTDKNCN